MTLSTIDLEWPWMCQAELEQQVIAHKDVQRMLMTENEALQQQIVKLRHDLVRSDTSVSLITQSLCALHSDSVIIATIFHRLTRTAYLYNECLQWCNVVITSRVHSSVNYSHSCDGGINVLNHTHSCHSRQWFNMHLAEIGNCKN